MGQGASTPGPPGKDGIAGKDGNPGKDAVVDYIQLVNKTVNDEGIKSQIKGLLNDMSFKKTVTDYISANADTFRGPKGETEFKNLTADEQIANHKQAYHRQHYDIFCCAYGKSVVQRRCIRNA